MVIETATQLEFNPKDNPLHISLDSLDLRPALTVIRKEIDRIRDVELQPNQKLVILALQHHEISNDHLIFTGTVKNQYDTGVRFLAAIEDKPQESNKPQEQHHAALANSKINLKKLPTEAPYTRAYQNDFLYQNAIPTIFNDIHVNLPPLDDSIVRKATKENASGKKHEYNSKINSAMNVRNQRMADTAWKKANALGLQTIIQAAGCVHGFSMKNLLIPDNNLYSHYKTAAIKEKNPPPYILPILPLNSSYQTRDIPPETSEAFNRAIVIQSTEIRHKAKDASTAIDEGHVKSVIEASGGKNGSLPKAEDSIKQMLDKANKFLSNSL